MIPKLIRRFFSVEHRYADPVHGWLAAGLLRFLLLSLGAWGLSVVVAILPAFLNRETPPLNALLMLVLAPLLFLVNIHLVRSGRLLAASLLIVTVLMIYTIMAINNRGLDSSAMLSLAVPLLTGGLLLNRRWLTVIGLFIVVGLALFTLAEYRSLRQLADTEFIFAHVALLLIFAFLYLFGGGPTQIARQNTQTVDRLQIVGRLPAKVIQQNETGVYVAALRLIRNDLGYDFAQVFLADEQGKLTHNLRLAPATKEDFVLTGVNVSGADTLAEAVRSRSLVLAFGSDPLARRRHFLSSTSYALAIPILTHTQVVAVLDVQNTMTPFTAADAHVLTILAESMTGLLVTAALLDGLREQVAEQRQAADNLRQQLHELKRIERQVVGSDWENYLQRHQAEAIGFDADAGSKTVLPAYDLPPDLRLAIENGQPQITTHVGEQVVAVPIILRGEVLGAMTFTVLGEKPIAAREIAAAQSIAERLATVLENKRLFEQTRLQAGRERTAGEIAGLLISATDVESVLALAANRFNEALGAISTRIHLQPNALGEQPAPAKPEE